MIDLHTHSTVSDGSDHPETVVELAAAAGCSALALTDHDSLAGIGPARVRATELGITFVPGCEVSCLPVGPGGMHVLVYFVEEDGGPFSEELGRLRADRRGRNLALAERLAELGLPVSYDRVVAISGGDEGVGRPHFAAALVEAGAVASIDDAFDRYLSDGRPGHVRKARLTGPEVASLARASGGVAVLAIPSAWVSMDRVWRGWWASWPRAVSPASRPSTAATPPASAASSATWPGDSTWWPPGVPITTGPASPISASVPGRAT